MFLLKTLVHFLVTLFLAVEQAVTTELIIIIIIIHPADIELLHP